MLISNKGLNSEKFSEEALDKFYDDLFNGKTDILKYGFSYGKDDHIFYFFPIKIPRKDYSWEVHKYYEFTDELIKKGLNKT